MADFLSCPIFENDFGLKIAGRYDIIATGAKHELFEGFTLRCGRIFAA